MERLRPASADPRRAKAERDTAINQARRRVILDGAKRVFDREGLDGATMRAIAAEAGCTTGAIYPLFPSNEAIYAALLAESLERLHEAVSRSIQSARTPASGLRGAGFAFLTYYRDRPDEVALGLYLWHGLKPRGLTSELDAELNRRLMTTLDLLRDALGSLARLTPARARIETGALFAFLIGALVVHQTGRLRMLNSELDTIAAAHLDALIFRLAHSKS